MVAVWAWIMMWTLIQGGGQKDWGLRDWLGSGSGPGGHGLSISDRPVATRVA